MTASPLCAWTNGPLCCYSSLSANSLPAAQWAKLLRRRERRRTLGAKGNENECRREQRRGKGAKEKASFLISEHDSTSPEREREREIQRKWERERKRDPFGKLGMVSEEEAKMHVRSPGPEGPRPRARPLPRRSRRWLATGKAVSCGLNRVVPRDSKSKWRLVQ